MSGAWRRQSTSRDVDVEVDLGDFSPKQLLQELIDDKMITEAEALAILKRSEGKDKAGAILDIESEPIDDAWNEVLRGRKAEALVLLERALGTVWIGKLT